MLEICNEKEKASLYFSVQDDGIGIEEEYRKNSFSRILTGRWLWKEYVRERKVNMTYSYGYSD